MVHAAFLNRVVKQLLIICVYMHGFRLLSTSVRDSYCIRKKLLQRLVTVQRIGGINRSAVERTSTAIPSPPRLREHLRRRGRESIRHGCSTHELTVVVVTGQDLYKIKPVRNSIMEEGGASQVPLLAENPFTVGGCLEMSRSSLGEWELGSSCLSG